MKKITSLLAVILALAVSAFVFSACGGSSDDTGSDVSSDNSSAVESSDSESQASAAEVDYSNPAVSIAYEDFDGIVALTDDVLAGNYDGQVIKIDGITNKKMSDCSIMEPDGSGTKRGMTWKLEGEPEMSEYPADDARVEITGVVAVGDYGVRYLLVPADNVKVIE